MVGDGTFTYAYSAAGRMVRAESVTVTLVYTYGPDGLRVAQGVDGVETTFAWDLALPLAQVLSTSDGALDVYGLGRVGELRDGEWAYPLPDALGSVRQWTDASAAVTYAAGYTPYGVEMWQQGGTASAWGYTGEWWDADLGLVYLRARWYDGRVGRFTRKDVWPGNHQQPLTMNPYLYAVANPVGFRDPSGRQPYGDAEEAFYDFSGTLAVLWYREMYMPQMVAFSHIYSIDRVELEAAMYNMAGGQSLAFDVLRYPYPWLRQDIVWWYLSRGFDLLAIGCRYTAPVSELWYRELASQAWPPSVGIAEIEPEPAERIERYWARQTEYWAEMGIQGDILWMTPPAGTSRAEWLTFPDVGIMYLAAHTGMSKREFERLKAETGMTFSEEDEWRFVGWSINATDLQGKVDELAQIHGEAGDVGVESYFADHIRPNIRARLQARYMRSPLPEGLTLSKALAALMALVPMGIGW